MYTFPSHLWIPQRRGLEETCALLDRRKSVCLYAPTGGGKTEVAIQLFNWAANRGWTGIFYVNRRLLISQTANRFDLARIPYGIRAADYDDLYDFSAPFQIASADTEASRVYLRKIWQPHKADLVIVDEAHIQKGMTMKLILEDHMARGAKVVLLTATPIGLSKMVDELVVSGTLAEYRACKALVPAVVRSIEQPDLSKVKRNKTGEYILDGKKKAIYTQSIVGHVLDRWKKYNPDARPTMLYAPGVAESVWFTEQFRKIGVNWCHVDATDAVVDGVRATLTRPMWDEILERFKAGDIKGISSRFKTREGLDLPNVYHCILATPIGSLASYIQTVGRCLRYSAATPDRVIVTDHGGSYLHHGSPNHDRPWKLWWNLPEHVVSSWHQNQIRDGKVKEPIRCPKCEGERVAGITCPHCGYTHPKSQRNVIMEDGRMVVKDGKLIAHRRIRMEANTQALWDGVFWGWRKSRKCAAKSFSQMSGWFAHQHGYHPPRTLKRMPIRDEDWHRKVQEVPMEALSA